MGAVFEHRSKQWVRIITTNAANFCNPERVCIADRRTDPLFKKVSLIRGYSFQFHMLDESVTLSTLGVIQVSKEILEGGFFVLDVLHRSSVKDHIDGPSL